MKDYKLTKEIVHDFLSKHKLMTIATYGEYPWIASVYYSYDQDLNIYFLSDPNTLHCKQLKKNPHIALSIVDSHQTVSDLKKGLQVYGKAEEISQANKIRHALSMWKEALNIVNPKYTYENMIKKIVKGRMFKITPKKIKLFDQALFPVEDGQEPILLLNK